ncbi:hypothetical protein ACP3TJ_00330 [Desulforudis sp. 1088]|uniref:flagellin N-terminal helical domain-containing protein n=1 Tax=unclassified Candidatus Desulforudis TaxID=2635950 RepID=UPI003CE5588C
MRIATNWMGQSSIFSIQKNAERMETLRKEIASGLRINHLSDDPSTLRSFLNMRSGMVRLGHYTGMVEQRIGRYQRTESALAGVVDVLARAQELALQAKNGTLSGDDRKAIAGEVDGLIDRVVVLANASRGLTNSSEQLYVRVSEDIVQKQDVTPAGEAALVSADPWMSALAGETAETIDWAAVFGESTDAGSATAGNSMFKALLDLKDALVHNDVDAIGTALDALVKHHNTAVSEQSAVGAKINTLNAVKEQLGAQDANLAESVNTLAGTKLEDAVIRLNEQQLVYEATLSATARMLQISLLNFLR